MNQSLTIKTLTFFITLILFVPVTFAADDVDPSTLILDVKIDGNKQISATTINDIIKTRKGRPFSETRIEEDKRALMNKGVFIDVVPDVTKTPNGYIVTFRFTEKPILHYVKFVGNYKINRKRLLEECGIDKDSALDAGAVHQAKDRIETLYKMEGYNNVHVEILSGDRLGDHGAVFLINEMFKQKVLHVAFEGNKIASDSLLRTKIDSKAGYAWLFGSPFTREMVEHDVVKLIDYYRSLGFYYAKVDYEFQETRGYTGFSQPNTWVEVKFLIDEGVRCKLRDIRFVGNKLFTDAELRKELKSKIGYYFYKDTLDIDMTKLKEKHGVIGHIFADAVPDPRIDGDQIDLIIHIKEGPKCRVGELNVEIVGSEGSSEPYTALSTVLTRLSIKPGDVMNSKEMKNSERRLQFSGLFNSNPSKGMTPTITFEYPEQAIADEERETRLEEERQVANGNPNYRGQQPLGNVSAWNYVTRPDAPQGNVEQSSEWQHNIQQNNAEVERELEKFSDFFKFKTSVQPQQQIVPQPVLQYTPQNYGNGNVSAGTNIPVRYVVQKVPIILGQQSYGTPAPAVTPYNPYNNDSQYPQTTPQVAPLVYQPANQTATQQPDYSAAQLNGVSLAANLPTPPAPPSQQAQNQSAYQPQYLQPYSNAQLANPYIAPVLNNPQGASASTTAPQPLQSVNVPPPYVPPAALPLPENTTPAVVEQQIQQQQQYGQQYNTTTPSPTYNSNSYGYSSSPITPLLPSSSAGTNTGVMPFLDNLSGPPRPTIYDVKTNVKVQETQTGQFMVSLSVNSDSGLVGRIMLEEQNFDICRPPKNPFRLEDWRNAYRGRGQTFRIEAMPGEYTSRYQVTWGTPYLFNLDYSFNSSAYYYQRYYDEWSEERLGGSITIGKNWTKDFSTALSFDGANVKLYHPAAPVSYDLMRSLGNNAYYAFGLSATHDTRNSPYLPSEGHMVTAGVDQVIGTDTFVRGHYDVRQYFMLRERPDRSGRWVLGLRSSASIAESNAPIYERYFAGGYTNLRGFEFRKVTPRDPLNFAPIGGTLEFYNSAELVFPLTADDMVHGLFFVDSGTVQRNADKWDDEYRVSVGFGFRITIPFMGPAPIALDFGFPITKGEYDKLQLFTFSMGFMR
ncbi:MAG: BamA/TamA family outer membrane protein [Planctomycetaceae bacterium]|nr:BamA/TamA family outer membrane protein [Planctomycetaceae bacterium]